MINNHGSAFIPYSSHNIFCLKIEGKIPSAETNKKKYLYKVSGFS